MNYRGLFLLLLLFVSTSILAQQADPFLEQLHKPLLHPTNNTAVSHQKVADFNMGNIIVEVEHLTPRNTGSNELSSYLVYDAFILSNGSYYFITRTSSTSRGIDIKTNKNWFHLDNDYADPRAILEDNQSNLWILSRLGLNKYNQVNQKTDSVLLGDVDSLLYTIRDGLVDSNDNFIVAHNEYVKTQRGSVFDPIDTLEYIPANISVFNPQTKTIVAKLDSTQTGYEQQLAKGLFADFTLDETANIWIAFSRNETLSSGIVKLNPDFSFSESLTPENSNLPDAKITHIEFDADGKLWATFTDNDIIAVYYDGDQWVQFDATNSGLKEECLGFALTSDNKLKCGNKGITMEFDGTSWVSMPDSIDGQIFQGIEGIRSDKNGRDVYDRILDGVFINENDSWEFLSTTNDNGLFSLSVFGLDVDESNGVWATGWYGASYFDGNSYSHFDVEDGLTDNYSWKVVTASDGTIWFATLDSLNYLKDGVFNTVKEYGGFYGEDVYEDRVGNMWFGSYGGDNPGILKYNGKNFTLFPTDTVIGRDVMSLAQGPDDAMYAATSTSPIARYDGEKWKDWIVDDSLNLGAYSGLHADKDKNLWFLATDSSEVNSLWKWDGNTLTSFNPEFSIRSNTEALEADPNGNIWFADYNSEELVNYVTVFNVTDETWMKYPLDGPIYDIKHDGFGNTWIGTLYAGIYKFKTQSMVANEEEFNATPIEFSLDQNYPNPFNPSTTIQYTLASSVNDLSITVYNLLGKKVATIANNTTQTAGVHQVQFDASTLASGMYIYRIESSQFTASKKMLLIK